MRASELRQIIMEEIRKVLLEEKIAKQKKKIEQLDEEEAEHLSKKEKKEKEKIVKGMKDKKSDFEKRYPGRGEEVMYATATKMAKK